MHPLEDNPLRTREDIQRAVRNMITPLEPHFSPGNARVKPGPQAALFSDSGAELEGFSRPLWGVAPLVAGGDSAPDLVDRYRDGFANGSDPDHPEYWGDMTTRSQKAVEMAAIGVALALAADEFWDPLDDEEQQQLAAWLSQTNDVEFPDNNWPFFRVLANLGLRSVGADHDAERMRTDLDQLEENYRRNGWYADGPGGHCDYYTAWEFHVDGLLYARLAPDDPERADRFRKRAAAFADDFSHWFATNGAALPYGRSLTYRMAQSAFWGALPVADVKPDTLSWGQIKGLWLRNLRWWADQPIFTHGGVLSIGYGYPTVSMAETYNSPSSPYWAMKAFLPLALPPSHPFWQADEGSLPERDAERVIEPADMMILRESNDEHVVALTTGHGHVHHGDKYNKFAYSSAFGFSVASSPRGIQNRAVDSTLALSEDGEHYRVREGIEETRLSESVAYSRWKPWNDVTVDSWLVPTTPWHVRVHRVQTARPLKSVEGGFAFPKEEREDYETSGGDGAASAVARSADALSGLVDPRGSRRGAIRAQDTNTNLLHPRTVVPTLETKLESGTRLLTTAVLGTLSPETGEWNAPPSVALSGDERSVQIEDGAGRSQSISIDPPSSD